MPRNSAARFSEKWREAVGDEGLLESIVDRWRSVAASDGGQHVAMFAESMNLAGPAQPEGPAGVERRSHAERAGRGIAPAPRGSLRCAATRACPSSTPTTPHAPCANDCGIPEVLLLSRIFASWCGRLAGVTS